MGTDTQVEKGRPSPNAGDYASNGYSPGGLSLEVQAVAQLATNMAKLTDELAAERQRHYNLNQAIHPFNIPVNSISITSNAGTLNQPNLYGPQMGNFWDVRRIQATGFTAGSVTVYLNANGAEILAVLTAANSLAPPPAYFGSGQILLGGNDAMVFVAAGITGTPLISVGGVEVSAEWIGDYLL